MAVQLIVLCESPVGDVAKTVSMLVKVAFTFETSMSEPSGGGAKC